MSENARMERRYETRWDKTENPALKDQIDKILLNIEVTIGQVDGILIKLSSERLGRRVQWLFDPQEEMKKYRSSLESNETAWKLP